MAVRLCACACYLSGWRTPCLEPRGAEARPNWSLLTASGKTETREGILLPEGQRLVSKALDADYSPSAAPNVVRVARRKLPGFLFAVVLFFVCLHSNVLWRGFRAYFFLVLGVAVFMGIIMINAAFPRLALLHWIKYLVYQLPDIYISMDGYLFISSVVLLVWLFVICIYNRWTYITFEPGQVRIVQEIGGGETVFIKHAVAP